MKVTVHITETGETFDREMTAEEIAQYERDLLAVKAIDDLAD